MRKPENCRFLNVGGSDKAIPVSSYLADWEHHLLDIDPASWADFVMDARDLVTLNPYQYDSVYCSHNLEHYFRHDVDRVLQGIRHILKPEGFAEIRVPDMQQLFDEIRERKLDLDDVLYTVAAGDILVRDVIWGWSKQIEETGDDYFAHKTGFTEGVLTKVLEQNRFRVLGIVKKPLELRAFAFKTSPLEWQLDLLRGIG